MLEVLRALTGGALVWAFTALLVQAARKRAAAAGVDHSRAAGSPWRGARFAFTVAMLPGHKESVRLHPAEFVIGILLHLGLVFALADLVLLLVAPASANALAWFGRVPVLCGLLAAVVLAVRRARSAVLRAMSSADDYVSILLVFAALVTVQLRQVRVTGAEPELVAWLLLLLYVPLGKLRHAAFFFVARADLGRRLGHRGTWSGSVPASDAGPRPVLPAAGGSEVRDV